MLSPRPYVAASPQPGPQPGPPPTAGPGGPYGQHPQPGGFPGPQPGPPGQPGQPPVGPGGPALGQPPMSQPFAGRPLMEQPPGAPPFGGPPAGQPPFGGPQPGGFPGGPAQQPFPPQQFPGGPQSRQQFPPPQPEYDGYENVDAYYDDEPPRSRTPLYVGIGVVLVLALGGGAVYALQGKDDKPGTTAAPATKSAAPQPAPAQSSAAAAPTDNAGTLAAGASAGPNAAAQAKSLSDLLGQAENARAQVGSAVAKVRSCPAKPDVDKAVDVFDTGGKQRDQLLDALGKLNLGDVPGSADLAQALRTAWQTSGDIDRAYANWARTVSAQGCQGGSAPITADYKKADELNPQATKSKNDFITKWKSVADSFNLPESSADRI